MARLIFTTMNHIFVQFLAVLILFSFGNCAEIDDSAIFIEAFNAYQQKEYLLTLEKCDQLNQVFPDSPLKDVTLLLAARAGLKSGDNSRAAKSAALFLKEFPESSLRTSVDDELQVLVTRLQKGDILAPDKNLQAAARKVRTDRIARERAAEQKRETERIAKAKLEQERLARIKREEELREVERQQAEKRARASIKTEITIRDSSLRFSVGESCTLPVEISNRGTNSETFIVSVVAPAKYSAALVRTEKPDEVLTSLPLAAGETFKGSIQFRMPANMVDGHRSLVTVKVVSAKFDDISFSKDTTVTSSAPLVRVVAKYSKQNVVPGEKLDYRVTVLNAGSLPAQNLTVRLQLPRELEYVENLEGMTLEKEPDGALTYKIDHLDIGKLTDLNLKVSVRDGSAAGKELRGVVEIVNNHLQIKDAFNARTSVIQAK
jgi:uncharacterized repeat protein (TIGR01451 family)